MTTPNQPGGAVVPGDPFGQVKEVKKDSPGVVTPREVNDFHTRSDVDSSQLAQHHTLGLKRNQASSGMHNHDGQSARRVGAGMKLAVTGKLTFATVADAEQAFESLLTQLQKVIDIDDART